MSRTGEKDYYSILNSSAMKKITILIVSVIFILSAVSSCNRGSEKKPSSSASSVEVPAGLIQVGNEIITDVILRPDTLGDPWEAEKVKGFDADAMFKTLLDNIYKNKITVYSPLGEEPMKPDDVKKIVNEFGSDLKRIGKLQFCDDWFLDPSTGNVIRKTRSIILGYENQREEGLPQSYKAMFRIKLQ
jgi:hypothetical protein